MILNPLVLLFALAFVVSVDVRILAAVLPSIASSLDSTAGTIGLAMTAYALAYGSGQLIYGPISDRLGRITVVRVAGLGFIACTAVSACAAAAWQFVLTRLLAGAFAGAVLPLTLVFIGDTIEYGRRQVILGRFSATTSAALAISASIGGTVAYLVSWRAMLLGYAVLALFPVGCMWRLETPAKIPGSQSLSRFRDFLSDRRAQCVYAGVFLEGFLLWGTVTYLGAFGMMRHQLDQFQVGLLLALFGVGTMTGGLLMRPIHGYFSESRLAAAGGVLMGLALLVLVPRWPVSVFAVSMLALGLGLVSLHTTLQVRGTEISQAARGKAFSLFAFSLFGGMSAGTAVLGRLVDAGRYDLLFEIAAAGLIGIGLGTGAVAAPSRGTAAVRDPAAERG
ncbi:MAG TPA: MFS transporter [Candidatus Sulfotelmatobacter sp.]|nr:MFS transporter [Candidatus Sulfotelmatobacter sp.]